MIRALRTWRAWWPMAAAILLVSGPSVWARSGRVNQLPNGSTFDCANCHLDPGGGGPRNPFGRAVEAELVRLYGNAVNNLQPFWSSVLAALDPDDDGVTSGEELGDPTGAWVVGSPDPAVAATNPGDPASTLSMLPRITSQPVGQTVLEGTLATFTVVAHGTKPLSYQWRKDGADLPGAVSSNLTLTPVALGHAGTYTVVVRNPVGPVTSAGASLAVTPLPLVPVITTQPASQTVPEGGTATFTVSAIGKPTLSYQWRKDSSDLPGQTEPTLTRSPVALADAGLYTVVVSNGNGSTPSAPAALAVNALPLVSLLAPTNGASFNAPVALTLEATADDADGTIARVEFFDGTRSLGSDATRPYSIAVVFGYAGTHALTAVATDNQGATNTSVVVTVTVSGAALWNVDVTDRTFSPAALTITLGDTVRWTVLGTLNHTVTSTLGLFSAGMLTNGPGSTFELMFTNAGRYDYRCAYHDSGSISFQRGTILVVPPGTLLTVASSPNPATPGQPVRLAAQVSSAVPGAGLPTGTIGFKVDGVSPAPPVALTDGVATLTLTTLTHGFHQVTAAYAGDGTFTGATNTLASPQLVNSPPVPRPDAMLSPGPAGAKISLANLLRNDRDADGDPFTLVAFDEITEAGGTVTRTGDWLFYTPPEGGPGADGFLYTIADSYQALALGTVLVQPAPAGAGPANARVTDLGNGSYRAEFDGIPGRTYRIEYSDDPQPVTWQTLGYAPADPVGVLWFKDTPPAGSPPRVYRIAFP